MSELSALAGSEGYGACDDAGGCFHASPTRRGGDLMPTYSDIFQFCLVILGVISLVVQIINNKRK